MKLHLISGLPRSGRNLLATVLSQNPNFYTAIQTPLCELVYRQFNLWVDRDKMYQEDFLMKEIKDMQYPFLRQYIKNFYSVLTNKKIIFDVRHSWHYRYNIWMLKLIYNEPPKVICCIRNMEEIAASLTKLHAANGKMWEDTLLEDNNGLIDTYNQLFNTRSTSFAPCLHIVKYDDLVNDHDNTMKKIYKFIGHPYFKTNINQIKRNKAYDKAEKLHGLKGLHNIKKGLVKSDTKPEEILSKAQIKYWKQMNWWNR